MTTSVVFMHLVSFKCSFVIDIMTSRVMFNTWKWKKINCEWFIYY